MLGLCCIFTVLSVIQIKYTVCDKSVTYRRFRFDHADEDEVMATEGLAGKIDLIPSTLEELDTLEKKLEVCSTINSLKASVSSLETDVFLVIEEQRSLDKTLQI